MPRRVLLFWSFQIPDYHSESADMIRNIAWNILVPSSLCPSAYNLFNSMWVFALHFAILAVEMDASNRL